MDLMEELIQFLEDRFKSESNTTRLIVYLTTKCCDGSKNCRQCNGRGVVTDAKTFIGKLT